MAIITGTNGNDTLHEQTGGSTGADDEIFALDGDDFITMQENIGHVVVNGMITTITDTVHGGAGLDTLLFTISGSYMFNAAADANGGYAGSFRNLTNHADINFDSIEKFDITLMTGGNLTLAGGDDIVRQQGGSGATIDMGAGKDFYSVAYGGTHTIDFGADRDKLSLDYQNAQSYVYIITGLSGSLADGYDGSYYISGAYGRVNFANVEDFFVQGGAFNDTLTAGDGNDYLYGHGGNDTIVAGAGINSLIGGDGIDALSISLVDETRGVTIDLTKTVQTSGSANYVQEMETFVGSVIGSAYGDTLIEGRYDYDATFDMGGGDDTVQVADGFDTINGQAGRDRLTVDYSLAESYVYMIVGLSGSLADGYGGAFYISGNYARANFSGIEDFTLTTGQHNDNVAVGNGNDVVTLGLGNDLLVAGAGNDRLDGGDGIDGLSIDFSDETRGVRVNLLAAGEQQVTGAGSIRNFESFAGTVTGSAFADNLSEGRYDSDAVFNMGDGADIVRVADGTDTINGQAGNDRLIVDYGSAESYVYLIAPLSSDIGGGYKGAYYISGGYARANFSSIENFTVTGGAFNDALAAGDGNDVLTGGAGNDTVVAGRGVDTLDGGADIDALSIDLSDDTSGVRIDLSTTGAQQSGGAGSVTGFESFAGTVTGSRFADTLTEGRHDFDAVFNMGAGADTVTVSDGVDTINGEAGNDRLVVDYSSAESYVYLIAPLTADAAGGYKGAFYISGGYARANFSSIEDFTVSGSQFGDAIVTGAGDDVIATGEGNDRVTAGKGVDTLDGGAGIDALSIDLSDDRRGVTIDLGLSGQQQKGGAGRVTGFESFAGSVVGSAFNDHLVEGRYDFDAVFDMGAGNDVVEVADGVDTINGGAGSDRLVIDYRQAESYVYLLTAITGTLATGYTGAYYVSGGYARANFSGIENFTVFGGDSGDTLAAGDGRDTLSGGAGNDTIAAAGGKDLVIGGAGNDNLDGGGGVDTASYADAAASVTVTLATTAAQNTGGAGIDTLVNFENLIGSAFGDILAGDDAANVLTGAAGDDALTGNGGADTLKGGKGVDSLAGGDGDDLYYVDNVGDQVVEDAGAGIDTVRASVDYVLGANVENLTMSGRARVGTGNALGNVILGTGAADTIDGAAGNDTIDAGGGRDVLTGGDGADRFVFRLGDTAAGFATADFITDFDRSERDVIVLRSIDADGIPPDSAFTFIGGNAFNNVAGELRYRFANNDTLVEGDVDGNGVADFAIRLDGQIALVAGDFVL